MHSAKCRSWIVSLLKQGLVPIPVVIDETTRVAELDQMEIDWISKARAEGADLTNICAGGRGIVGYVMNDEQRLAVSRRHIGRKRPPETCERISIAKTGQKYRPRSEDVNRSYAEKRMSTRGRINRGPKSPETKEKIRATMKGRLSPMKGKKMSEQGRANIAAVRISQGLRAREKNRLLREQMWSEIP